MERNGDMHLCGRVKMGAQIGQAIAERGEWLPVAITSPIPPPTTQTRTTPRLEEVSGTVYGQGSGVAFAPDPSMEGSAVADTQPFEITLLGTGVDKALGAAANRHALGEEVDPAPVWMAEMVKLVGSGRHGSTAVSANDATAFAAAICRVRVDLALREQMREQCGARLPENFVHSRQGWKLIAARRCAVSMGPLDVNLRRVTWSRKNRAERLRRRGAVMAAASVGGGHYTVVLVQPCKQESLA